MRPCVIYKESERVLLAAIFIVAGIRLMGTPRANVDPWVRPLHMQSCRRSECGHAVLLGFVVWCDVATEKEQQMDCDEDGQPEAQCLFHRMPFVRMRGSQITSNRSERNTPA